MKDGAKVELISGGSRKTVTIKGSSLDLPANFKGTLRILVDQSGSNFTRYWGTGNFEITMVSRVCFELHQAGSFSTGDMTLNY